MNASVTDSPPFAFCPVFGPNDEIAQERGQYSLMRSRTHLGSGARIQRIIHKAMAGQPVHISVLGGSVTACHGAGDDVLSPHCWPSRFFEWWNSVFPHPMSELTNGAARKSDSSYFAYCAKHHLPDKTDLVILEFDADDPNEPEWLHHFELLVRSILVRPEQPAVILLGHFAPQVQTQNGFTGPELLHDVVAQFYDVPHISLKGALYAEYMVDPEGTRQTYYTDMVLASPSGHKLISDLLISYVQGQICSGWAATMGHAFDVPFMGAPDKAVEDSSDEAELGTSGGLAAKQRAMRVPTSLLNHRPSEILAFREVEPGCVVANDLLYPLPPSHFYGSGWTAHHPPKRGEPSGADAFHYWSADVGGSRLRVPIHVGAGEVSIYYLQSPSTAPLGRVECWVDDDFDNRMRLEGTSTDVDNVISTITKITHGPVSQGEHYVECVLSGAEGTKQPPFKMLGV